MNPLGRLTAAGAVVGAAGLAWSLAEAHRITLRHVTAPVLPTGAAPLRVLHLSDLHLVPRQSDKRRWVADLARFEPDLVVVTGDFLADRHAVPAALATLEPLMAFPGLFVLGSNDYYEPTRLNPVKYLRGPSDLQLERAQLPWGDLVAGLVLGGWIDLSDAAATLDLGGVRLAVRGVDDPHIMRDRYEQVAGPYPDADLRVGVVHAPYLRVLNAMTADGADLVIAGHTHGGQLCLPGGHAIVTNCDLPRGMAKGLHRYMPRPATIPRVADDIPGRWWGPDPGPGRPLLHVSAGLGTSPYAPVRFACPPEATIMTLTGGRG
ncbi:MAG: metallophosphoesterase [Candidatus Nanopelagicales bacterium]